ncbi:DNA mismatch repair protein MutL [Alicyclobacillus hesperidum subsp. aegles]|uniref:DNA mismatch repair endonuclease MutL n=1 Tax=Alicyclobacillus hesperidum TaxID=89784 RepID=UPI00222D77C2|nr:DNA mismatch repair endonuclease MutL [Alicyclobacillus hesperidum]GLG00647.1 DNA mismatch repair protein MutL [Alicyclobacillus hesperidum subsp. aegles]
MGHIQLMSAALANQIAAGEVVVRPASCVKELIENSLDAGARAIQVHLREGGIAEIVVIDDGQGMDEQDAALAFRRHATSKVYEPRDLVRIRTLGFRGEALASIAAVARVRLTTRAVGAETAVRVAVDGGEMGPLEKVGAPVGTRIEVRDLFYNTPARLKYLRTVQTEQARSVEVVQQAALSRADVAFSCQTEHHILFQTPGNGDVRAVLAALYGVGEAKQMLDVHAASNDYRVYGVIGRPTQARSSRGYAHLFVNGRPIRHPGIHQAVVQGYQNRLMVGKHPMYALYIEMDPSLVDVNVHPHKAEVRFSEEPDVTRLVSQAVATALDGTLLAATVRTRQPQVTSVQPLALDWRGARDAQAAPARSSQTPVQSEKAVREGLTEVYRPNESASKSGFPGQAKDQVGDPLAHEEPGADVTNPHETIRDERPTEWSLRPIGQALGMYILADDGESLYIIDQHAAHERVLYEDFLQKLRDRGVFAMPLLAPLELTLPPVAFERAMEVQQELANMGLTYEPFGAQQVVVRAVPDIWQGLDVQRLAVEVFDDLKALQGDGVIEQMRLSVATRACKAAIKANWTLSQPEMEALCRSLVKCQDPFHCPHGRPIFVRMTNGELERAFRRIV